VRINRRSNDFKEVYYMRRVYGHDNGSWKIEYHLDAIVVLHTLHGRNPNFLRIRGAS